MHNINPFVLQRQNSIKKDNEFTRVQFDSQYLMDQANLRRDIEAIKQDLIDRLEDIINRTHDNKYLNLKRSVFNDRLNQIKPERFSELDKITYDKLEQFVELSRTGQDRQDKMAKEYDRLYHESRQALQSQLTENKHLLNAFPLLSDSILHNTHRYLERNITKHNAKIRKFDNPLLKIMLRAMFKTSPFSEFTRIGQCELDQQTKDTVDHYETHTRINHSLVYRLAHHRLEQSDTFIQNATYEFVPSNVIEENGHHLITFLSQNNRPNVKIQYVGEIVKKMKIPAGFEDFFQAMSQEGYFNFREFWAILAENNHQATQTDGIQLIRRLMDVGLIMPRVHFDETKDLYEEITQTTKSLLSQEEHADLAETLRQIKHLVSQIEAETDYYQKSLRMKELRDRLVIDDSDQIDSKDCIFDDCVIRNDLQLDKSRLDPVLDDLKLYQKFTLLFDINIRIQLELYSRLWEQNQDRRITFDDGFFSNMLDVTKDFYAYFNQVTHCDPNTTNHYVKTLDRLRNECISEIRQLITPETKRLQLKPIISKYVALIPEELLHHVDLSSSLFVQFHGDDCIINAMLDGQEKFKARFMDYFPEFLQSGPYLDFVQTYYNEQNYYELLESLGFAGNIKQNTLTHEVLLKAIGRRRFLNGTGNGQYLEDMELYLDPSCPFVQLLDKHDQPSKVVLRGSLVQAIMPGYVSFVSQLFSSGRMTFLWKDIFADIDHLPRFYLGNVVLERSSYRISSLGDELQAHPTESKFEHFYRVNQLFHDRGWARRFFLKSSYMAGGELNMADVEKPMYVDISNPLMFGLFIHEIYNNGRHTHIEEYYSDDCDFTTEYDIEIFKRSGGLI